MALGLVAAILAGFAIVAPGFDATRTPVDDGAVWAIQSGENLRYARVNLEIGELDIVKRVDNPSAVLQSPSGAMVFTSNYARYAQVSAAAPSELLDEAPELVESPAGTQSVQSAGDTVILHTSAGEVYVSSIGADAGAEPGRIDLEPEGPDAELEAWIVDAVALGADGLVVGWNAAEGSIGVYDLTAGSFVRIDRLEAESAPGPDAQVTIVAGRWAVLDEREEVVFLSGREGSPTPVSLGAGAVVQRPSLMGDSVLVSDELGLIEVPFDGSAAIRIVDDGGIGVPAAATELDGVIWAAWLAPGLANGTLWNAETGAERQLDYAGAEIGDEPQPMLQSTGARMAVNDAISGWVWSVPDGTLVPSSQDWTAGEQEQEQAPDEEVVSAAVDPKPPVVVDDAFGVRAGASATLPVLLNDSDPNGDILTIVPSSVEGLNPAFGTVTTAAEDQTLVIQVAPGASGSASFSYRAEDGTADGGLVSVSAATVSVTVIDDSQNSAPVWCGVDGCTAERTAVQVGPGSSVEFDWLRGWVDPEGDPLFVSRVEVVEGKAVAAATDAGRILVQHTDPNDGGGRVQLDIAVSDVRGAETVETIDIAVTAAPAIIAESFAVVAQAGSPVEIDPTPHMSGGSGPLTVVSAIPAREGRGEVQLNAATGVFTLTAPAAGSYLIDWTVSDGVREQIATARVTLREGAEERLTVAPVIAFVRPQEDASVDVFSAVSNPAGRVLLLSEISVAPAGGSNLFASTVGRDLLRVSGTTANLQPGLLGEVGFTVSDGTGRPEATARGVVVVYLLPVPPAAAPIAIDDVVTVRAGDRVDVQVLDNDVPVLGNAIAFDPRGTQADAGLAFTTSRALRILAPDEPGSYSVRYSIYSVGYPGLSDVGTVYVTVLPAGPNSAPAPTTLVGRVVSGGTVSLPFSSLGVDPDGDEVVLDAILDQPARGVARISGDGRSIVYTSLVGDAGEVSFGYRVRDARGLTGESTVRIGVLAADEDPSPIAYSDYVQVTLGVDSFVVVNPLQNDVDPARTTLTLLGDPIPNVSTAEGFEAEYAAAVDRIVSVDGDAITFRAGNELGTFSYFYDVANEFGDVSRGTIVMRVVRESVASIPVVTDTVLTAETRASFTQGVDVVSGRVAWPGGDVSTLQLSLWRDEPGVTVQGSTIRGELPDRRTIIPFELTGEDFLGQEVVSYGFLVVPGPLDLPPTVRPGATAVEVKEREQVSVDISDLIVIPAGVTLEIDAGGVRASGQRSLGECRASGDLSVVYVAGENSPWRDFCIVPVRYAGQESFTYLAVAVRIIPGDPQPELRSASLEVSPGDELVYDFGSMTSWQGDAQSNASYSVSGATGSFEIVQDASTQVVTIRGLDAAVPGSVEVASIGITNPEYEGVLPAGLTLRVGPAPATLPKGGTTTQECGVSQNGSQCTIRVIGVSGEVNPLPRTPLVITAVTQPQACPTVSFAVSGTDSVTASWSQETPGAVCSASFTVRDAQSRESASDRNGTVVLDFQGLPAAAASVVQTSYGDRRVTLAVSPGASSSSYPSLTSFEIVRSGTVVATCSAQGACSDITDVDNGTQLLYEAYAVNAQGRSLAAPQVTAWAYAPPAAPTGATSTPTVPQPAQRENWPGQQADFIVSGISDDTAAVQIRLANGTELPPVTTNGASSVSINGVGVGSNTPQSVTVTAISRFPVPVGTAPSGGSRTIDGVHGIGAPTIADFTVSFDDPGGVRTAFVSGSATANGTGSTVRYTFLRGNSENNAPTCPGASSGDWSTATATTFEVANSDRRKTLPYVFCAQSTDGTNTFGFARTVVSQRFFKDPGPPQGDPTYTVSGPLQSGNTISWSAVGPSLTSPNPDFSVRYTIAGSTTFDFALPLGVEPGVITAQLCDPDDVSVCSPSIVTVSPAPGQLDRPVQLTVADCVIDEFSDPVTGINGAGISATFSGSPGVDAVTYSITVEVAGRTSTVNNVVVGLCPPPDPPDPPDPETPEP